jgi:hypothetical protein
MAVDRGGLEYTIRVRNQFSEQLRAFKSDLAAAKATAEEFKKAIRNLTSEASASKRQLGGIAKSQRDVAAAQKSAAAASTQAAQQSSASSKQRVGALSLEEKAERKLARILEDKAVTERAYQLAKQRGNDLTKKEVAALTLKSDVENKLLRVENSLASLRAGASNARLAELTAEESALKRILAAQTKAKAAGILGAQGLGPSGAPSLSLEQQAQEKLAALVAKRAVSERALQLAKEQGIDLSRRSAAALRAEASTEERIAEVEARLASLRGGAASSRLNDLKAEEIALKRVQAAALRALVTEKLREQGLDSKGGPLLSETQKAEQSLAALRARTSNQRLAQLRVEEAALKRIYAAQIRQGVAARLAARGLDANGNALKRVESRATRAVFTFRRLFGVLAAFTAARLAGNFLQSFIGDTVRFSSEIESARLGVAALFTALGTIKNAQGQVVTGADALNVALGLSDDQLRKLRVESLKTAATFDQLASTFQIGLGPGLSAGLNVDQVRKFTVQISQAASALGVEQNQLSEEIRSLLSGTIQQRTTRIAAALGITNEDIRKAKEAGNLYGFLQERFDAFSVAGERALNTFSARATNARDALLLLSSTGSAGFFDELKGLLRDIAETAVEADSSINSLSVNKGAAQAFSNIFDGLRDGIQAIRGLKDAIPVGVILQITEAVGSVISLLSSGLSAVIEGFVLGLGDLAAIFNAVAAAVVRLFSSLTGGGLDEASDTASSLLSTLTELVVVVGGLKLAVAAVAALFGGLTLPVLVVVGALTLAFSQAKKLATALTGLKSPDLAQVGAILEKEVEIGLRKAAVRLEAFFTRSIVAYIQTFQSKFQAVLDPSYFLLSEEEKAKQIASAEALGNALGEAAATPALVALKALDDELEQFRLDLAAVPDNLVGGDFEIYTNEAQRRVAQNRADLQGVTDTAYELKFALRGAFSEVADAVSDIAGADTALGSVLGRATSLEASLARISDTIKESTKGLQGINKELQSTQDQVDVRQRRLAVLLGGGTEAGAELAARDEKSKQLLRDEAQALFALEDRLAQLIKLRKELGAAASSASAEAILAVEAEIQATLSLFDAKRELILLTEQDAAAGSVTKIVGGATSAVLDGVRTSTQRIYENFNSINRNAQELARTLRGLSDSELESFGRDLLAKGPTNREETARKFGGLRDNNRALLDSLDLSSEDPEVVAVIRNTADEYEKLQSDILGTTQATLDEAYERRLEIYRAEKARRTKAEAVLASRDSTGGQSGGAAVNIDLSDQIQQAEVAGGAFKAIGLQIYEAMYLDEQESGEVIDSYGDFFSSLGNIVEDFFKKLVLKQALLGLLGNLLGVPSGQSVGGGGAPAGFAEGGPVSRARGARPSLAHFSRRAQGLSLGGPPAGISPSDTVPAWLDPAEYVLKGRAHKAYGTGVMNALNSLSVPVPVMRAVAARRATSRPPSIGMAQGGPVSSISPERGSSRSSVPGAAIIQADEQAMERMLKGGDAAMVRWYRQNRSRLG